MTEQTKSDIPIIKFLSKKDMTPFSLFLDNNPDLLKNILSPIIPDVETRTFSVREYPAITSFIKRQKLNKKLAKTPYYLEDGSSNFFIAESVFNINQFGEDVKK